MPGARIHLVRGGVARVKADVSDSELLEMLSQGHPLGVRTCWLRYAPIVHRLLKHALGHDIDVAEFAQLVFISLVPRASTLRDPSALRPLVIALTTDTVRAELRRRWMHRWLPLPRVESPGMASVPPNPASRAGLRRLDSILDRFNSDDRLAFAYHFLEGLSLEDVAGALHLSLPATQRKLARVWNRVVLIIERDSALLDYLSRFEGLGATA